MLTSWKHHACVSANRRWEARVWWENPVCHVFLRVFDIFDTERDRPIRKTRVLCWIWRASDFFYVKRFLQNKFFLFSLLEFGLWCASAASCVVCELLLLLWRFLSCLFLRVSFTQCRVFNCSLFICLFSCFFFSKSLLHAHTHRTIRCSWAIKIK